jgi:1,4-alpha-glucan branching enzyme
VDVAVWAPHADSVAVRIHPDPQQHAAERSASRDHPLDRSADGWWAADVPLERGDAYRLAVRNGDDEFERIDPLAREVTSSVGHSIARPIELFDRGDFVAPPRHEWVLYELHPGTFGGSLDGVVERLDHLVDLGVNAIELMPVSEFAGDLSWGYNPALPYAVESSYGGPDAMRRLVSECHARGIAVVVDVVYNHLGPSDLDLWRFDGWYEHDGGGIYFYNDDRARTPWGDTRPDYGRREVRDHLIGNARMWFAEYGVDGLRLDSTINIRNIDGSGDASRGLPDGRTFLQQLNDTMHSEFPYAVMIAEDLLDDPVVCAPTADGGLGFDLQWAAGFVHPVRAALTALADEERDAHTLAAAIAGGDDAADRVVYTESHDEVANGSTRVPAEIDGDDPASVHAFRRSALGAVAMFAARGVPMMFQGQEWGDEDWFHDDKPLDWSRRELRPGTVMLWRDLIHLRTVDGRTGGLRGDQVEVLIDGSVVVVRRWGIGGPESATVVALNLGAHDVDHVDLALPAIDAGRWEIVLATDWSGYHSGGSDLAVLVNGGCALAGYAAVIVGRVDG